MQFYFTAQLLFSISCLVKLGLLSFHYSTSRSAYICCFHKKVCLAHQPFSVIYLTIELSYPANSHSIERDPVIELSNSK